MNGVHAREKQAAPAVFVLTPQTLEYAPIPFVINDLRLSITIAVDACVIPRSVWPGDSERRGTEPLIA
jgi:hypothetical protein